MTERFTGQHERTPSYNSFSDVDEALAWVYGRLKTVLSSEAASIWWTNADLDGVTPETMWDIDPDRVIKAVAQFES